MEPKSKKPYFQIHHLYRRFILHAEKFYDSNGKNYTAGMEARNALRDLCRAGKDFRHLTLEENNKPPRKRKKSDA